jgi:phage anti-repressor protein
MNTPNYILQRNNQTVINLRPIHERMGFTPAEFPSWFKDRIRKMNLTEGQDFEKFSENRHYQYVVPVKVALSILNTVPAAKAAPIKKEIAETFAASIPSDVENKTIETPEQKTLPLFVSEPTTPVAVKLTGPVGVMQIEGRAAVNAGDLFKLWAKNETARVNDWVQRWIVKYDLFEDRDYVEYKAPDPVTFRKVTFHILSIDAAIIVAKGQPTGKGRQIAEYLTEYRKDLKRQKLPTKGRLSDFIGMEPTNVAHVEPEPMLQIATPLELLSEHQVPTPVDPVTPRPVNSDAANPPDEEGPHPVNESPDWVDPEDQPEPQEGQGPNMFDLMVKFSQGLLQQAQAMADLYRQMLATSGTVSELVKIEQQAALRKLGLYPGKAAIPAMTLRDKINHAVSKRAGITGEKHEDIFKAIYARLANDYGYSVLDFERKKGQSHLQLCEELGIISIVWDIVNGAAFNRYVTATPKATA